MEFKENEKYTEDMLKYFGDDEFILINSILSKIDISKFDEKERKVFNKFREIIDIKAKQQKESLELKKQKIEDMTKQIDTNNFRFICGITSNTCKPRCLDLHTHNNTYYCTNIRNCANKKENQNYK